jgi:hypothetical protein
MEKDNKHGGGSMQTTENSVLAPGSDLFSPPLLEGSLLDGSETMYRPLNKSSEGPIEFNIKSMGMKYIHLSRTVLCARLKITAANGNNIPDAATAAMVNLPLSSIFKTIDIDIAGVACPDLGNTFSNYKAYFETVLTYSQSARDSHLRTSLLHMDTAGHFEDYAAGDNHNQGYQRRLLMCRQSATIEVCSPVHCDFLQINKYFPPGAEITIRFHRASDAFCIVAAVNNVNYRIEIEDIKLYIRHVTLADDIVKQHMKLFEKGPAIFPYNRTVMKTVAYPGGLAQIQASNLFTGILPKSIIFALINAPNFNGTYMTNPYYFQHFNCNYFQLNVNGENVPTDAYRPDFERTLYSRELRSFFNNVGIHHDDMGNVMTPELYAGGMFLMAYDLSPESCNGFHAHKQKSGLINFEMGFTEAIANPFNLLAFATYDQVFLLDKDNRVTTDMMFSS